MSGLKGGVIPVLSVVGQSVAETWEKSLLELWENGTAGTRQTSLANTVSRTGI